MKKVNQAYMGTKESAKWPISSYDKLSWGDTQSK